MVVLGWKLFLMSEVPLQEWDKGYLEHANNLAVNPLDFGMKYAPRVPPAAPNLQSLTEKQKSSTPHPSPLTSHH